MLVLLGYCFSIVFLGVVVLPPAALPGDQILKIWTNGLGIRQRFDLSPIRLSNFSKVWLPAGPPEA
jgi:hypothetical protein